MRIAPVLAIMVCHDGEAWLPRALAGVRESSVRPQHVIAVDTGSQDSTPSYLTEAAGGELPVVDEILTVPRATGFAEAVTAGVEHAEQQWDEPGDWIWVLHDDCTPEPDCLAALLNAAEAAPSAGVLGPLALDWNDARLIVEAGLATDASGHRRTEVGLGGPGGPARRSANGVTAEQSTEVLAVPSAGALIHGDLWRGIGGFDTDLRLLREDIDFGWRANAAGWTVLCVPVARTRHARALGTGARLPATPGGTESGPGSAAVIDRTNGLRTYLANCSRPAFVLGVPRLLVLGLVRAFGFLLLLRPGRSRAELAWLGGFFAGSWRVRQARAWRRSSGSVGHVRGLFVGRLTRLRYAFRAVARRLVRRNAARDASLGVLAGASGPPAEWVPRDELPSAAIRSGSLTVPYGGARDSGGEVLAVAVGGEDGADTPDGGDAVTLAPSSQATSRAASQDTSRETSQASASEKRPSPGESEHQDGLVFVEMDRKRLLAATLFAPPVLLLVGLTALALVINWDRLGLNLAGGRLLPVGDLAEVWSAYLSSWQPSGGGTSAHAPPALAVLGVISAPLYPLGGPPAAVALVLISALPLAGLTAYAATRNLAVARWVRALVALGYALLPAATAAIEQGRFGVVVAHILLPLVLMGVAGVLRPSLRGDPEGTRWLTSAVAVAIGLAVLGAFSPMTHLVILVGLLAGFVVVPSGTRFMRRISSLAIVVLLPIALLMPWPLTLITNPELVVHGLGARAPEVPVHSGLLFSLHPGGAGALPIGALLVAAALVAVILRPRAQAFIGVGVAALGAAATGVLQMVPAPPVAGGEVRLAWAGAPLLIVGAGLLTVLLAVASRDGGWNRSGRTGVPRQLAATAGGCLAVAFAASAMVAGGQGPLGDAAEGALASSVAAELAETHQFALVLRADGDPPRQAAGGMPAFGSDDLPLPDGTPERLRDWQDTLAGGPSGRPGPAEEVQDTIAAACAAGIRIVVLPHGVDGAELVDRGGELISATAPAADGRDVVRLEPVSAPVTLIAPELSRLAVGGEAPPGNVSGNGVSPVDASLPDVRARVSDGVQGRLLVLAATHEAGWRARVDGEPAPIVQAWGHQVGVEVPTRESEVVVENADATRNLLLLAQLGAVLFTLLIAIPSGRKDAGRVARAH